MNAANDLLMPQSRIPWCINGLQVGSVLPSDVHLLRDSSATIPSAEQYVAWDLKAPKPSINIVVAEQTTLNTLLAAWAQAFHAAGRLKAWRNELLNVSPLAFMQLQNPIDLPVSLALVERGAARVLGILTHAVHLVGTRSDGKIWVQQRALGKATDPGLWDTLAGGLLSAGDSLVSGVLRETHEEAGLLSSQMGALSAHGCVFQDRTVPDGHILEAVWTFSAEIGTHETPHNLDGEAMGFACLSIEALRDLIKADQVTTEAQLSFRQALGSSLDPKI